MKNLSNDRTCDEKVQPITKLHFTPPANEKTLTNTIKWHYSSYFKHRPECFTIATLHGMAWDSAQTIYNAFQLQHTFRTLKLLQTSYDAHCFFSLLLFHACPLIFIHL